MSTAVSFYSASEHCCELVLGFPANHRILATGSDMLRSPSHIYLTKILTSFCSQRFRQRLTKSIVCGMSHTQDWKKHQSKCRRRIVYFFIEDC